MFIKNSTLYFLPHRLYVQMEGVQCREASVLVAVYEVLE